LSAMRWAHAYHSFHPRCVLIAYGVHWSRSSPSSRGRLGTTAHRRNGLIVRAHGGEDLRLRHEDGVAGADLGDIRSDALCTETSSARHVS
jgi:hypothetical protein